MRRPPVILSAAKNLPSVAPAARDPSRYLGMTLGRFVTTRGRVAVTVILTCPMLVCRPVWVIAQAPTAQAATEPAPSTAPATLPSTAPSTLPIAPDGLPDGLDAAVERGLEYLAKRQNADGSFGNGEFKTAVSGLSVMAFLACGHTPGAGRYGLVVRGGVDFLLAQSQPDGYYGKSHDKGMYDQGIVTLALAEAYGVEPDLARRRRMHTELTRAVKVIVDAQSVEKPEAHVGGWRYKPDARDSDLSLSGWNALALRAAQDAGIEVPKEAVQKAVGFLLRCYNAPDKGFSYQPGGAGQTGPTGIGLLGLYLLDSATRPEIADAAKFLASHPVNDATPFQYYAMYYVTQAAHQAGGETWPAVFGVTSGRLLRTQTKDGSWPKLGQEPGKVYATSMAVLTLTVPYGLLPVYQR